MSYITLMELKRLVNLRKNVDDKIRVLYEEARNEGHSSRVIGDFVGIPHTTLFSRYSGAPSAVKRRGEKK